MGEVNKRRGRVLGMTPAEDSGMQIVEGEVPMAEMDNFATYLRQVTQAEEVMNLLLQDMKTLRQMLLKR